jgi:PhnB protein
MAVKPIPEGYHTVTPYLIVKGGAQALDFYKKAFGAVERLRMGGTDGKIGHAEITINGSAIMLADEFPEMGAVSPQTLGGSPVGIHLYVEDVDAQVAKAVAAGATVLRPLTDMFYGDRTATIADPFGHKWSLATHKEDVSHEELQKRAAAMMKGKPK